MAGSARTLARSNTGGLRHLAARLLTRGPLSVGQSMPTPGIPRNRGGGTVRRAREIQTEAYGYYRNIGGVHYTHTYIGNAGSKLYLEPAIMNPDGGAPIPLVSPDGERLLGRSDTAIARDAIERLGDQSELNRLGFMNLSIAGESLVVFRGKTTTSPEQITARSVLEVRQTDDQKIYLGGDGTRAGGGELLTPDDDVIRIWKAHPERRDMPDSWTEAVRDDCFELMLLNREIRARVQSRLATAGLLLIPDGLRLGPIDPTAEGSQADPLVDELMEAMTRAISTPGDPASVIPIILTGEGDELAKVRWIISEQVIDATGAAQREEKLRAIAVGADIPAEILTGKADLNHWTGAIIDDNTNAAHIQPMGKVWADGMTVAYHRPACQASGMSEQSAARIVLVMNSSQLVVRPNRAQDAKDAHKALAMSNEALLRYLGFPDGDLPTAEEIATRLVTDRARPSVDAPLAEALLRYLLPDLEVERSTVQADGTTTGGESDGAVEPDQVQDGADPSTGPEGGGSSGASALPSAVRLALPAGTVASAAPGPQAYRFGQRLTGLDRTLRTRLATAADAALTRALERAGNRAAGRAQANTAARQAIDGVPRARVCAVLGAPRLRRLGMETAGLIGDDAWADLADRYDEWTADSQEQALALVGGWLGLDITSPALTTAADRMATARASGRAALVAAMTALAHERLFDPNPNAPDRGEHDTALSVPHGTIRDVVAIAGGTPDGHTPDALTGAPAGGIGTGQIITVTLADHGVLPEEYEWSWGGASRPFPPHEDIDGVRFTGWDDPAIANPDGWPSDFSQPGDHSGCFVAGTIVSGPAPIASSTRHYEGPLVTIKTAGGKQFTATPNHPVLTTGGWVPAGLLDEGHEVIGELLAQRPGAVDPDHDQPPALIEQVAAAVPMPIGMFPMTVPVAAEQFHGDGAGSKVAVVRSDRDLRDRLDAAGRKPSGDLGLTGTAVGADALTSAGAGAPGLPGLHPSMGTGVGNGELRADLLGAERADVQGGRLLASAPGHPGSEQALAQRPAVDTEAGRESVLTHPVEVETHGVGDHVGVGQRAGLRAAALAAEFDAGPHEDLAHGLVRYPEATADGLAALPAFVGPDQVVEIIRNPWASTHVYNLQTGPNWYLAAGIIVHNCTCDALPLYGVYAPAGRADAETQIPE